MYDFLVQNDPENDRRISDHVLRIHRYRNPNEQDGEGRQMGLEFLHISFSMGFTVMQQKLRKGNGDLE